MVEVEVGEGLLARVGVEALCEQMALELRRQRMCDAGCELRRHRVCGGRDRAGHDAIHRQCARILSRARVPQVYHEEQECKIRQGGHQGGEEWLWWGYGGAHLLSDDREGARVPRGRECVADDGEWHGREAQAEAHRNCGDDAADFRLGREVSVTDGRHPATHKCTRKAKARPRQGHTQVYTRKGRRVSTGVITQCDTTDRLSAEATQLSTHGRVPGACRRRELRVCNSARSESLWGGRRGSACAGGAGSCNGFACSIWLVVRGVRAVRARDEHHPPSLKKGGDAPALAVVLAVRWHILEGIHDPANEGEHHDEEIEGDPEGGGRVDEGTLEDDRRRGVARELDEAKRGERLRAVERGCVRDRSA